MIRARNTGIVMLAALATVLMGSAVAPCDVRAQGSGCVETCRAAYGSCYRATANRSACDGQLQRCMQGCIASKR